MVRAARGERIPLRRRGAHRPPGASGGALGPRVGRLPVHARQSERQAPGAVAPRSRAAGGGSTWSETPSPTRSPRSTAWTNLHRTCPHSPGRGDDGRALPAAFRGSHRSREARGLLVRRQALHRLCRRHPRLRAARPRRAPGRAELQIPSSARCGRRRGGGAQRPRPARHRCVRRAERAGDPGGGPRRAGRRKPELLAERQVRRRRGERPALRADPRRLLLQDLHVARTLVDEVRALHPARGGARPRAHRAGSGHLRQVIRALRRPGGGGRPERARGGPCRGADRCAGAGGRRASRAGRPPARHPPGDRRRVRTGVDLGHAVRSRGDGRSAGPAAGHRPRLLRSQLPHRPRAAHRPSPVPRAAWSGPPAPVEGTRETGRARHRRARAPAGVQEQRPPGSDARVRGPELRQPVRGPSRDGRGGVHQQRQCLRPRARPRRWPACA